MTLRLLALGLVGALIAGPSASAARADANLQFLHSANRTCYAAHQRLDALPAFPFRTFDPQRPDAGRLLAVGRFLTGPGNPQPILQQALSRLEALGPPPTKGSYWESFLSSMRGILKMIRAQNRAALAGDAGAFARSARTLSGLVEQRDSDARAFGAYACWL